ncbi:response regulator transcription factor [Catenuloplanes indicus]|uniref:DNA-binding NarL/FixJ family response regulator n=1 Tax=Catenuloplanes indicus TaxID=137267 RepID=A0AAE3W5S2_9ACTN|nr:response regulator transcription factor [Catenuloplanes indicus]MDQ0369986.1 DNA-binding NarL/FixJ family response regulator [Catenuloplanes indicus]
MLTIAIVDDHPVKRAGLEKFVAETSGLEVATSVRAVEDLAADVSFDVAILDVPLRPGGPALSAIESLVGRAPVVVSSTWERPLTFGAVLRTGVRGFTDSRADGRIIVSALFTVGEGGFYVCPRLADRFQSELVRNVNEDPAGLAPREVETLRWIARGLTHSQIAGRMGLTEATVNTYAKRIRAKLNAGNKAELTRMAIELGHMTDTRRFPAA